MKEFIKYTLASFLGIILAGCVFLLLGIAATIGIIASTYSETTVQPSSVLMLDLQGTLHERVQENPLLELLGEDYQAQGLDDILHSIRSAKHNSHIRGIYLQAGTMEAPLASLEEIRDALKDFQENGKFVVAYGDQYSQGMYYLASIADKVIVNPQGSISWHGLASQPIFYKDLLKKVGIEMQIFKVGTYKAAVEPFIATEMSDANRKQITDYLHSIWGHWLENVSASRQIPADVLNKYAEEMLDLKEAEEYISCGLADTLLYKDGVLAYLKEMTGCSPTEKLNTLSPKDLATSALDLPSSTSSIAVYYAFGEIDSGTSTDEGIHSEKVITDLRKLREDESIKAVVLRVNSPGGSAYGSEQIWREVALLKARKPVIVSMGDYAASGGYYISCAANCIVAQPTTLTGSIGIFGMFPNAEELLTDKLDLHFDMVKTHFFADMGDLTRPLNNAEKNAIQDHVNRGYQLFLKRCADGRDMDMESLEKIAEGRVWTGADAKELGLVDELGGLDKALSIAAQEAGLFAYDTIHLPLKNDLFTVLMNEFQQGYIGSKFLESLGNHYDYARFLRGLKHADRIQARMPFDLHIQ